MTRMIDFCYDLNSPFAHIALHRLNELPDDVTVRPVPVLLGAILSHHGQKGPAEIPAKRLHTYRISLFTGEKYGLEMRFPPRHPFNPLAAQRLLAGSEADLATVKKAFSFVFEEGRTPDTPDELAAFAAVIGVDVSLAGEQTAKDALRANTERAITAGLFGVPSFIAGGEVFWGVDSFDMLKAWLASNGTLFGREPYAGLEAVEVAAVRT